MNWAKGHPQRKLVAHRGPEARTCKQMAEQAVAHTGNAGFGLGSKRESWESGRTLGLGGSTGSVPKDLEGKLLGNTGIRVQPRNLNCSIHPV